MKSISLARAKAGLSELVRQVHTEHERVQVTVHGATSVVLVAPEDLASLEETIEVLSDADTVARLMAAESEIARGEGESVEQLAEAMRLRRAMPS